MNKVIKIILLVYVILIIIFVSYILLINNTSGESIVTYADNVLYIDNNWRATSLGYIGIWEEGSDDYHLFITDTPNDEPFSFDISNVPEEYNNYVEQERKLKKNTNYYLIVQVHYDFIISPSGGSDYYRISTNENNPSFTKISIEELLIEEEFPEPEGPKYNYTLDEWVLP